VIALEQSERSPGKLRGRVGPLHVHANLLDEADDGAPDPSGAVEWYVTAVAEEYRNALLEGYSDSLDEARAAITSGLDALRQAIEDALVT